MSFAIQGLATAQPDCSIQQSAAAEIAKGLIGSDLRKSRGVVALFDRTKVHSRGSVLLEEGNGNGPEQSFYWRSTGPDDRGPATAARMQCYAERAIPMALAAARGALDAADINPGEVSHVVTVSCTGFFAPGVDIALIKTLGLPPTVGRLNVGFMGCHGVLNGLRAVQAIGDADRSAIVLLCAVELCSLHYQYGRDPQKLLANALFADGAAALVGRGISAPAAGIWRVTSSGSCVIPDAEEAMSWCVGDHGFEMTLSPLVPALIAQHLHSWIEDWLAESGKTLPDIRSWAIHPGGPRILSSVADTLNLPREATRVSEQVLAECGNMSSPTVLFVLDRLRRQQAPRPCVALAFGPGLVAEATLIE